MGDIGDIDDGNVSEVGAKRIKGRRNHFPKLFVFDLITPAAQDKNNPSSRFPSLHTSILTATDSSLSEGAARASEIAKGATLHHEKTPLIFIIRVKMGV